MSPRLLSILLAIAGVVVMAGGAAGFASKGSVESLVVAGTAGLVWLTCAVGLTRRRAWAAPTAMAVGVVLALAMGWRWASTGSVMPALPVIALSVAVVVVLVTAPRIAP
jgi:uncharacterized membrane protein (UPF0136 family)